MVFIGTSNAGVFIVTTAEDADTTLGFYTWRVRAELRHARNLRQLAKRTKLMEGYTSTIPEKKDRATITSGRSLTCFPPFQWRTFGRRGRRDPGVGGPQGEGPPERVFLQG